ncbi:hypothetical protein LG301_10675 [Vreelandella venusta]|uniref:hypothetical protein n=1 Tax=Vreelandella venusta TaxID=44935 RepID=UPI00384F4EF9
MTDFTMGEKDWIEGWLEGRFISSVRIVLSSINVLSVDDEQLAQALGLPEAFVRAVKDVYSLGVTDPEKIVEQIDIESDDFVSWREASVRRGVEVYIQRVCEKRFGELPDWVFDKLRNARNEELQKWLYGSQKYRYLEEIFLGFELGQQILQVPPEHWEERSFNKGMRSTLRVQLHEKFGDLPLWVDEAVCRLKYDQLLRLSRDILSADSIECLLSEKR